MPKGKTLSMKEIIINQFKHSLSKLPYDISSRIKRDLFTLMQTRPFGAISLASTHTIPRMMTQAYFIMDLKHGSK